MSKPIVPIDWDGTLTHSQWPEQGAWKDGAVDFLKDLQKRDFKIVIHSCRARYLKGHTEIHEMLRDAGLRDVEIWTEPGKPIGVAYPDDRGVNAADGDWGRITREILALANR